MVRNFELEYGKSLGLSWRPVKAKVDIQGREQIVSMRKWSDGRLSLPFRVLEVGNPRLSKVL
jgi:hypothetical protein